MLRNSSIEILKLVALILIIFSSATPYGATVSSGDSFVDLTVTEFTFKHLLYSTFRWCGQIGDTLFIVCSAWFLCDSDKFKIYKVYKMIMDSWILSFIGLIIACLFMSPTFSEIVKSVFPITFQRNWFVGCYIFYYLLHPLINKAVSDFSRNKLRRLIVMLFLLYSVLSMFGSYYYFTPLVAFISIHIFVMYNKKYLYKHDDKYDILKIFITIFLIFLWIIGINFIGGKISFFENKNLMFCHYYNPVVIILAISALNIATRREWESKFVNKITSLSLLIYLIHANYFWLTYGKYWFYKKMSIVGITGVVSTCILIIIYIIMVIVISILYEHTVGWLISNVLIKVISSVINKMDKFIARVL